MRLRLEMDLHAVRLRPGAEEELEAFLRTLIRTWSMGAAMSRQSIEMCGFGEVRLAGLHLTKK